MMKKLNYIIVLMTLHLSGYGQQLPMYTQYMNNSLALNPAVAGSVDYTSLRFTSRQQWLGIKGAPSTQLLSLHSRLGMSNFYNRKGMVNDKSEFDEKGNIVQKKGLVFSGKEAVGCLLYNDRNGPIGKTGLQLIYAYHFPMNNMRDRFNNTPMLSVGLALSFMQFTIDESQFELFDANDPIISGAKESFFVPDVNFGAYLYAKKYYAGFSATQLIQPRIKVEGSSSGDNKIVRHYFFAAGYKFETYNEYIIEPSVFVKATEYVPIQVEINARMQIDNIDFGLSYRTNNDIIVLFGMKVGQYYFAYSFDYSITNIIQYSSGSHEIVLGYNIGESIHRGYKKH